MAHAHRLIQAAELPLVVALPIAKCQLPIGCLVKNQLAIGNRQLAMPGPPAIPTSRDTDLTGTAPIAIQLDNCISTSWIFFARAERVVIMTSLWRTTTIKIITLPALRSSLHEICAVFFFPSPRHFSPTARWISMACVPILTSGTRQASPVT